jgi:8-oxo-dGTP pyrophosphatase MutT (NUDIX family)
MIPLFDDVMGHRDENEVTGWREVWEEIGLPLAHTMLGCRVNFEELVAFAFYGLPPNGPPSQLEKAVQEKISLARRAFSAR